MLNKRRMLEVLPYLENRVSLRVYSTNDIIFTNLMSIIFKLLNMHNNNNNYIMHLLQDDGITHVSSKCWFTMQDKHS